LNTNEDTVHKDVALQSVLVVVISTCGTGDVIYITINNGIDVIETQETAFDHSIALAFGESKSVEPRHFRCHVDRRQFDVFHN
jgi:hypothetical protein